MPEMQGFALVTVILLNCPVIKFMLAKDIIVTACRSPNGPVPLWQANMAPMKNVCSGTFSIHTELESCLPELYSKTLVCDCPMGQSCEADVLISACFCKLARKKGK